MIKLRPFVIAQANRLENVAKNLPNNTINAIKSLNAKQIRSIFNSFVPLDFIALINILNKPAFEQAIDSLIFSSATGLLKDRKDIETQDLAQSTFINLMGSKERPGVLTSTLNQGSLSRDFNYTWKGTEKQTSQQRQEVIDLIRNNIKPNKQGMLVPFCPFDLQFNKQHLLWDIKVTGNTIEIIPGYDSEHRCTSSDVVDDPENLTPEQKIAISNGLKTLEQKGGQWILRCTFQEKLSTFSSFLTQRVRQTTFQTLNQLASEKGEKKLERKEYQELFKLENKMKSGFTLTSEEQRRYKTLKKKLQKAEETKTQTVSLDKPVGEESRPLHDIITTVSEDDLADEETVRKATISLLEISDEEFLDFARSMSFKPLLHLMKQIADTPLRDPSRIQKQQQLKQLVTSTVLTYLNKNQTEITQCLNCRATINNERCIHAEEMRNSLYTIYLDSSNPSEIEVNAKKLNIQAQAHFRDAGMQTKLASFFDQQDLFSSLGLDLEVGSSEKLSKEQFFSEIQTELTEAQRMSYLGSNTQQTSTIEEGFAKQVDFITKKVQQGLDTIFNNELEDELRIYIEAFGA